MEPNPKFYCSKCDFKCIKKTDYTRHLNTKKHQKKCEEPLIDCSICGKIFSSRTTLWRHKKACADTEITTPPDQMTSELTNTNEELLKSVNKMVASFSDLHNVMVSNANLFGNMIDNVKQLLDENMSND
jgi:uncharacterized C2H2 Zn-finger protein